MQIVYNLYRDREITYPDGTVGVVCGYTDTNLLLAVKTKPEYAFRRFGKELNNIEEQYKTDEYRYVYCSEKTAEEQHPCTPINKSQK